MTKKESSRMYLLPRKIIFLSSPLVFLCLFLSNVAAALQPARVISLKPNITSIIFTLGEEDRLVGVTTFCDRPTKARELPKVADYTRPFFERVIASKPDLVITSKEEASKRSIEEIKKLGIRVILFDFGSLDGMLSSIQDISNELGVAKKGKEIVLDLRKRLEDIRKKYLNLSSPRVLVAWGLKPFVVAGEKSYMNEFLKLINAKNVVSGGSSYPHWGREEVMRSRPDVIIDLTRGMGESSNFDWTGLAAKIYRLDASDFRMSADIVDTIERLAQLIHREGVDKADVSSN